MSPPSRHKQVAPGGFTLIELLVVIAIIAIWPFCKSTDIFHCPGDPSMAINAQNQKVPRVRSMSMSNWVGGNGDSPSTNYRGYWGLGGRWKVYRRITEMNNPGPARTFVLL